MKQKDIWISLFAAGLVMILAASELSQWFSRIFSNEQNWRIAGILLSVISGSGLLFEMYFKRDK